MGISQMVQQSDPSDAARAALSAANSILADTSAPDEAREQAQQLIDFAKTNDIAATLRGQRVQATDGAAPGETPSPDFARPDIDLFFEGDDLVVKLAGYGKRDQDVDLVVNGTTIELKTTAEPQQVLQSIDVHRPITAADLTTTVTDDGLIVRIHQYAPDSSRSGRRPWFGLRSLRR